MFNYVVVRFLECILLLKELDVCCDPSKTEIEICPTEHILHFPFYIWPRNIMGGGVAGQELHRFDAGGLGGQWNRKLFPETRVRP